MTRAGGSLVWAVARGGVTRRRVEMHVPRSLRSSPPLCSNSRSLARVGEPDRCEFHAFLPAGGCIARPQRQEFVTRSGVFFGETPLQIE